MRKVFLFEQDEASLSISHQVYEELMLILQERHPEAEGLAEDEELSQLHGLLVLLRQKQINLDYVDSNLGMFYLLEVLEDAQCGGTLSQI